ncbi:hypothetical protein BC939DRAFT_498241 [Gamsiella multidivaricata]|uniref:uncharacterized protein n=1 Tax=Gamsiella multidivaricata TaxID=101098 RepID=UPI0022211681|nr:uncharacterized protein BC939DRAFT_498241 [Gamsiella multidivaricata]KAG0365711.1 hypothetical protein BGZ54_006291 [Gamsiella multidivaricata]KAI7832842.1 hypothetical protein BC939DRAFT_498241 [Gamsiella multidivaricata]
MTNTLSTTMTQRTSSGGSQRKRLAVDAAKRPRMFFPTTLQPDAQDRIPTMSIADSALLQATLAQSRYAWSNTAFTRFIPEPPARAPGGKKYASELTPVGSYTVCIGPHLFFDTKFFAVFNPTPPPPSIPISGSTIALNTAVSTPTEDSLNSPSSTPPAALGRSPAPEKTVELAAARTDMVAGESSSPTPMDIDSDASNTNVAASSSSDNKDQIVNTPAATPNESESKSESTNTPIKMDGTASPAVSPLGPSEKSATSSRPTTLTSSGAKVKTPAARPLRPMHQMVFEFKENSGVRWLFPYESSVEFTPAEGEGAAKISASFYVPTMEEPRPGLAGTGQSTAQGPIPGPGQATTLVILQATLELWFELQRSISDSAATYRFMMEKMKQIPPRVYVQYNLPLDFPDDQLQLMGLKKLPDHRVVPLSTLEPSKRTIGGVDHPLGTIKVKRLKTNQDENTIVTAAAATSKGGTTSRRNTSTPNNPSGSPHQKQCAYCGSVSTPMWRRGPDGSHNLCNACGVKWRHGKIFIDVQNPTAPSAATAKTSSSSATTVSSAPSSFGAVETSTKAAESATGLHQNLPASGENSGQVDQKMEGLPSSENPSGKVISTEDSKIGTAGRSKTCDKDKTAPGKKRGSAKASPSTAAGPKLVPIHQIGGTVKQSSRVGASSRKDRDRDTGKDKVKAATSNKIQAASALALHSTQEDASSLQDVLGYMATNANLDTSTSNVSLSAENSMSSPASVSAPANATAASRTTATKVAAAKTSATATIVKSTAATSRALKQKTPAIGTTTPAIAKPSLPTSAAAKLSLLKSLASTPRYQISHSTPGSTASLADDGLSLYATKNLYTNNTATFPLHFPTISIAFGPNNAYYMYPNCAVVLFENHFQIKLINAGERTDIDVWKEGIVSTEFQVVDVGDGESMIVMRALLRQHLSRFDKELLNPDENESAIVFRFRERLDGGGPPVKPLLEQWLKTEIPVAAPPGSKPSAGSCSDSGSSPIAMLQ